MRHARNFALRGPHAGALILCVVILSACTPHRTNMYPNLQPALTFEVDGLRINYTRSILSGDQRPVIVLIHGFGASLQSWNDIYPAMSREYSVVRLDLKGSGFSSKPHDDKYAPEQQAALVVKLLDGLKLRRVVLVGHSLGGGIALLTALSTLHSPTISIRGMVLIDSAGFPQQLPFFVNAFSNPFLRQINRAFTAQFKTRVTLRRLFVLRERITEERVWRYAYFLTLAGSNSALAATAIALKRANDDELAHQLSQISVPVLIIWGQVDPAIPVSHAYMFRDAIPDSTVRVLQNTGHVPHEERPEETFQIIRTFLETLK